MGLIRKKPFTTENNKPLYTLGLAKTMLIAGLGNAEDRYTGTRHNIGFECLDSFAAAQGLDGWIRKKDLKSFVSIGAVGNMRVVVVKPTTMMNNSGEALQAVSAFYKIQPNDIIVVHDELDIDFGQIRCRMGGGAAGNNGIKSVIKYVGDEFGRVRIGIGPKQPEQMDSADFVLAQFTKDELTYIPDLKREVSAILTETLASGVLPHDTRQFIFTD